MSKIEAVVASNMYVLRGARSSATTGPFGDITESLNDPAYDTGPFTTDFQTSYEGKVFASGSLTVGLDPAASAKYDYMDLRGGVEQARGGVLSVDGLIFLSSPGTVFSVSLSIEGGYGHLANINGENTYTATAVSGEGGAISFSAAAQADESDAAGSLPRVTVTASPQGRVPSVPTLLPRGPQGSSPSGWGVNVQSIGTDTSLDFAPPNGAYSPYSRDGLYRSIEGERRIYYGVPKQVAFSGQLSRGAEAEIWCEGRDQRQPGGRILPQNAGIKVFMFGKDGEQVGSANLSPNTAGSQTGVSVKRSTAADDDDNKPDDDVHYFLVFSESADTGSGVEQAYWQAAAATGSDGQYTWGIRVTRQLSYNL